MFPAGLRLSGSNRAALAWSSAYWSAAGEPLPDSNVTDTGSPPGSTPIRTTVSARMSVFVNELQWEGRKQGRRARSSFQLHDGMVR